MAQICWQKLKIWFISRQDFLLGGDNPTIPSVRVRLSVLPMHLSIYMSIYVSIHLSLHLSIGLITYPYVYLYIRPPSPSLSSVPHSFLPSFFLFYLSRPLFIYPLLLYNSPSSPYPSWPLPLASLPHWLKYQIGIIYNYMWDWKWCFDGIQSFANIKTLSKHFYPTCKHPKGARRLWQAERCLFKQITVT